MTTPFFLFLDFDGVLHPVSASRERRWSALYVLEELLQRMPWVAVVVTSSYREFMSHEEILNLFPDHLRDRIVGFTPVLSTVVGPSVPKRQREVLHWINERGIGPTDWIALDDDPDHYAEDCPALYRVQPEIGLTYADVASLCARIEKLIAESPRIQ